MQVKWNATDLVSRLDSTFIRYKGSVYFCRVNRPDLTLYRPWDVNGEPYKRVHYSDQDIDVSSLPLGYVNYKGDTFYVKRIPYRRWKQGLDPKSCNTNSRVFYSKEFCESVEGKFPSVKQAISMLNKHLATSVAISRDVALKDEGSILKVFIQEDEVGYIMRESLGLVNIPSEEFAWIASQYLTPFDWVIN